MSSLCVPAATQPEHSTIQIQTKDHGTMLNGIFARVLIIIVEYGRNIFAKKGWLVMNGRGVHAERNKVVCHK